MCGRAFYILFRTSSILEQAINQISATTLTFVFEKIARLRDAGNRAYQIEIRAFQKCGIVGYVRRLDLCLKPSRSEAPVNPVGKLVRRQARSGFSFVLTLLGSSRLLS